MELMEFSISYCSSLMLILINFISELFMKYRRQILSYFSKFKVKPQLSSPWVSTNPKYQAKTLQAKNM